MDAVGLIVDALAPITGRSILDIGCGGGYLARSLLAQGASVTGIDPSAEEIARAATIAPAARFEVAWAEALPFPDACFSAALFLNSLHHVPAPAMAPALADAGRVTGPGGTVIVIEPLPSGTFFAAFRPIEDETAVRAAAQAAVRQALEDRVFKLLREVEFNRRERFEGIEPFLIRASAADPGRSATIDRKRDEIADAFRTHAVIDANGRFSLDQPLRAHILRPAGQ